MDAEVRPFGSLSALLAALRELPPEHWVDLPEGVLASLEASTPDTTALALARRLVVRPASTAPRMGSRAWMRVGALQSMELPGAKDLEGDAGHALLQAQWGRSTRFAPLFDTPWSEADLPAPAWPAGTGADIRLQAWALALRGLALAWEGHASAPALRPASQAELHLLEHRLGCALPPALRDYHLHLGATDFGETLLPADGPAMQRIEPLEDAFPGIEDLRDTLTDEESTLIPALVCFGDYLGNGNLWCFHRDTGEVWYLDHDTEPLLTRMFGDVAGYLDALSVQALVHTRRDLGLLDEEDAEEQALALLRERVPGPLLRTWMY